MERFHLPLGSFDAMLLPAEARELGTSKFREAVGEFFQQQIHDSGLNATVTVTSEQVVVTWAAQGTNPIHAAIEKLKRGQLREGIQLLELIRNSRPDSPEILYNLGVAWSELGEPVRAVPILRHLTEVAPNHIHGRVALGVALGRLGDNASAENELAEAVSRDPNDAWARNNLGGILFNLCRNADALRHLEAAVALAPSDAHSWLLFGHALAKSQDPAAARQAYRKARGLDPYGSIGERASQKLSLLATDILPRNADGINPEALQAMIVALKHLRSLTPEAAQQLTLQAAILGHHGLRLQAAVRVHRLEDIEQPLTGLEVACLIHAGVRLSSADADTGLPLDAEYRAALGSTEHGE